MRARWSMSLDVRTQTEYGTLRAYNRAGFQSTIDRYVAQGRIYTERGFIQFAGFTFGKSQSYFDFFGGAFCYGCGYTVSSSQTGAAGTLLSPTRPRSATASRRRSRWKTARMRRNAIWDAWNDATNALVIGTMPGPTCGKVLTLATSAASTSATTRRTRCPGHRRFAACRPGLGLGTDRAAPCTSCVRGYYGNNTTGAGANGTWRSTGFAPSDTYGWAVDGGLIVNLPWAKGDKFWIEGAYSEGARAYVGW